MTFRSTTLSSQPQYVTPLSNIGVSPVFAVNFAESTTPRNKGKKGPVSFSGTGFSLAANKAGVGVVGNTDYVSIGGNRSFDGFAPANSSCWFAWSFIHGAYVNNGSSANSIWAYGSASSNAGFFCNVTSTNALNIRVNPTYLVSAALVTGQQYNVCTGRDDLGNCWLWINGKLVASGTGATTSDSAYASTLSVMGDSSLLRPYQGSLLMFAFGSENPYPFGAGLSSNPWQLFSPQRLPIFVEIGAMVSLPTLGYATSDISTNGWIPSEGTTLYGTIDEPVYSDTDYISVNILSTCEVGIEPLALPPGSIQTISYRASSTTGNGLTVTLKQGTTTIGTWSHGLTSTLTTYTQILDSGQTALISTGPFSVQLTST